MSRYTAVARCCPAWVRTGRAGGLMVKGLRHTLQEAARAAKSAAESDVACPASQALIGQWMCRLRQLQSTSNPLS